jgi:hypothetical protein
MVMEAQKRLMKKWDQIDVAEFVRSKSAAAPSLERWGQVLQAIADGNRVVDAVDFICISFLPYAVQLLFVDAHGLWATMKEFLKAFGDATVSVLDEKDRGTLVQLHGVAATFYEKFFKSAVTQYNCRERPRERPLPTYKTVMVLLARMQIMLDSNLFTGLCRWRIAQTFTAVMAMMFSGWRSGEITLLQYMQSSYERDRASLLNNKFQFISIDDEQRVRTSSSHKKKGPVLPSGVKFPESASQTIKTFLTSGLKELLDAVKGKGPGHAFLLFGRKGQKLFGINKRKKINTRPEYFMGLLRTITRMAGLDPCGIKSPTDIRAIAFGGRPEGERERETMYCMLGDSFDGDLDNIFRRRTDRRLAAFKEVMAHIFSSSVRCLNDHYDVRSSGVGDDADASLQELLFEMYESIKEVEQRSYKKSEWFKALKKSEDEPEPEDVSRLVSPSLAIPGVVRGATSTPKGRPAEAVRTPAKRQRRTESPGEKKRSRRT